MVLISAPSISSSSGEALGVALHRSFNLPAKLKSARLRLVADFALVRLKIHGQAAGVAEPYHVADPSLKELFWQRQETPLWHARGA